MQKILKLTNSKGGSIELFHTTDKTEVVLHISNSEITLNDSEAEILIEELELFKNELRPKNKSTK